ncbi:PREDICTED: neuropeptide Y receptor type 2-like [Nicrophorus vespilloides]|uniref:Neuropeptide Y receptor type 2-like n=1 Tax=Nicrophorus vespilloides TaxID=110193 RepID=A0ABM1MWC5_NICVS|nr:PREDICTED: neuropeptide Y receptor type 2-like [Nicrophorus vespilloides]
MNGSNLEEDAGSGKNDTAGGRESAVTILTEQERMILFGIFTVLMTIAVVGNVAAINATIRRKHRFLQKTCIISLAVGDLLIALAYGVNNLEKFSHAFINWTLGSFMCHFIPMVQVFGITASTVAIVAIALDRYRNVVYALDNQWNPKPMTCIAGATILWTICIGKFAIQQR